MVRPGDLVAVPFQISARMSPCRNRLPAAAVRCLRSRCTASVLPRCLGQELLRTVAVPYADAILVLCWLVGPVAVAKRCLLHSVMPTRHIEPYVERIRRHPETRHHLVRRHAA